MDIILGSLLISLIFAGILVFTLGGKPSSSKASTMPTISCPPGFSPSLYYKEKYSDIGIAYDEKQKAICMLQPDGNHSQIISHQDILAAAVFEDDNLVAKSVRTDESGKALLAKIRSKEIRALFQDDTEQSEEKQQASSGGISSTLDLRILINNPEHPIQQVNFLNMEAKKGGVIHNEAVGHVKNWKDLLGFLIRLASKPVALTGQPQSSEAQQKPLPTTV